LDDGRTGGSQAQPMPSRGDQPGSTRVCHTGDVEQAVLATSIRLAVGLAWLGLTAAAGSSADGPILFEPVRMGSEPPAVRSWISARCDAPASTVIHDEGYSYVIVCRGTQRTSGYGVAITEVMRQGDRLVVTAAIRVPVAQKEAVLMVITRPMAMVRIPRHELPLQVRFVQSP
jgi:hypothetical protein